MLEFQLPTTLFRSPITKFLCPIMEFSFPLAMLSCPIIIFLLPFIKFCIPRIRFQFPFSILLRLPIIVFYRPKIQPLSPSIILPFPMAILPLPYTTLPTPLTLFDSPFTLFPNKGGVVVSYLTASRACRSQTNIQMQVHGLISLKAKAFIGTILSDRAVISRVVIAMANEKDLFFMLYDYNMFYFSPYQCSKSNNHHSQSYYSLNKIILMKAYAVVKKPPPTSYEHTIIIRKEQPKIVAEPILYNRMAGPHRSKYNLPIHQIPLKASYLQLKQSSQPLDPPNQNANESIHSEVEKVSQHKEEKLRGSPQIPEYQKQENMERQEQKAVRARTWKLFKQFPSAKKQEEEQQSESHQNESNLNITPVDFLKEEPSIHNKEPDPVAQNIQYLHQQKDIVFEKNSKKVYCCGLQESRTEILQQSTPKAEKSHTREPHSHKRPIFKQFESKKESPVQQYTFKDQRSPERLIKIQIFELSNIGAFDI